MGQPSFVRFHPGYFGIACVLFLVEAFIAFFIRDQFVRPLLGDLLVVVWLYTLVRAFCSLPKLQVALGVLLFAVGIEFSQWLGLVQWMGWEDSRVARIVLGQSFDWKDLVAYFIGTGLVLWLDQRYGEAV
jgi:hypothetical protein